MGSYPGSGYSSWFGTCWNLLGVGGAKENEQARIICLGVSDLKGSIMDYGRADDHFYMSAIEHKASKLIYKRFRVNRYELIMLCALAAYLQLHGRKVISKGFLFDWLAGNRQFEARGWVFLNHLINKGAIHRLAWRNKVVETGNSLALSGYGVNILATYYDEIARFEEQDKIRKSLPGFRQLVVNADQLPTGYTLRTAGRND